MMLMILLLSEADVANVVSMSDGVRVVEQALRHQALGCGVAMPRISADVPGNGGAFRIMPAIIPEIGFFGLKTLTGYPGRRLPGETYFALMLFSCDDGALRAIVAGNRLTGIRTGAASGVAAKYLARPNCQTLGVIGAGVQARFQVAALLEVRSVTEIRIFDIESAKAETFAREIELEFQVRARAVRHVREAVSECDLVVTATAAKAPVFNGEWLEEGTHLSGMGSNTPNKRELDSTVFTRSTIVVDFKDQALQEAGDLQDALRTGAIAPEAVNVELGDILAGKKPGRQHEREITLFKSVGMAVEDIATATYAYERALAEGLGTRIDFEDASVLSAPAALAELAAPNPSRAVQS
jgi:alanine dehydrogenase